MLRWILLTAAALAALVYEVITRHSTVTRLSGDLPPALLRSHDDSSACPRLVARAERRSDLGETHLWAPHVVRADNRYIMVFQSGGSDGDRSQIRLAESTCLERWTRVGSSPLFEDLCVARDPMLRREGEVWTLYSTRCSSGRDRRSGVAHRTSRALQAWSAPAMALTVGSTPAMSNSGYTESPFVFERNGWYYLTGTSYPVAFDATFVYCSRSPFHFSEPPIERLQAHAAEWIFTASGQAFMTHCGPGQGGVWASPMVIQSGD